MSWQSEKEEDEAFYSLSEEERKRYTREYEENGGNVRAALDAVLGPVWFDPSSTPKGKEN
jgi:hypothetical protein